MGAQILLNQGLNQLKKILVGQKEAGECVDAELRERLLRTSTKWRGYMEIGYRKTGEIRRLILRS